MKITKTKKMKSVWLPTATARWAEKEAKSEHRSFSGFVSRLIELERAKQQSTGEVTR